MLLASFPTPPCAKVDNGNWRYSLRAHTHTHQHEFRQVINLICETANGYTNNLCVFYAQSVCRRLGARRVEYAIRCDELKVEFMYVLRMRSVLQAGAGVSVVWPSGLSGRISTHTQKTQYTTFDVRASFCVCVHAGDPCVCARR